MLQQLDDEKVSHFQITNKSSKNIFIEIPFFIPTTSIDFYIV
jgi:hypothetical protein